MSDRKRQFAVCVDNTDYQASLIVRRIYEVLPDDEAARDDWVRLRSNYREGDEFYFFRSDERSWAYLRGGEGYILIRGNEEVGRIVTSMN